MNLSSAARSRPQRRLHVHVGRVDNEAGRLIDELVNHNASPFTDPDKKALGMLSPKALQALHDQYVDDAEDEDLADDPNHDPSDVGRLGTNSLLPPSTLDALISQGRVPKQRVSDLVDRQQHHNKKRELAAARRALSVKTNGRVERPSKAETEAMLPKSYWK